MKDKNGVVVLSLFDGMSCGQIALNRLGVNVKRYYASEIDKYAIAVTQYNYPDTIQLGDITKWREWDIDWGEIDLVIGGSPCQGLSASGKGEGLEDPRSKLFFDWIDIRNHAQEYNPNLVFLLENVVPKKKEWADNMTCHVGVDPIRINSALVSAQQRERLYWINANDIVLPEDRGMLIKDIVYDNEYSIFFDERIEKTRRKVKTGNYIQWDVSGKGYFSQQDRAYFQDKKYARSQKRIRRTS